MLDCWGTLDILINNAGIAWYGPTEQMPASDWDRLLQINLLAPIQLVRDEMGVPVMELQDAETVRWQSGLG